MERSLPTSRHASTQPLVHLDDAAAARVHTATAPAHDPELIRVCLACGAELQDRSCKLVCRCGYFLSCSDYL